MRVFKEWLASRSRPKVTYVADPDRPPTILGPYGEGYCTTCRFVVGLNELGLLLVHSRGSYGLNPTPCKGSGRRPPKGTPYASRLSAFRAAPRKVDCPLCSRKVIVLADGRIQGHPVSRSTTVACKAGWHTVPMAESMRPRDHSGERG